MRRSVSVIVPTFREAENVPVLTRRLDVVARDNALDLEMIIVDDRSDDEIVGVAFALGKPWLRVVVRNGERSLSRAVVEGLSMAKHDLLVVMDADLSHPPEAIPALLNTLTLPGVDFVLGSRHVEGATIDESWTFARRLNSLVARWLARPLTAVGDPTSGFFALRRETFLAADELQPIGYKIGLELMIKCRCEGLREVPIHFAPRLHGESKLDLAECLRYVRHIKRLMVYRFARSRGSSSRRKI